MLQRTLRSGTSMWRAIGPEGLACGELDTAISCEVAVVGGGITGALAGYLLAKSGLDCVVIDREEIGTGSTAASTGLLQHEVDTPLVELIQLRGESHAVHAYRRGLRAVDELQELATQVGHAEGFVRQQTLCLASSQRDLIELRAEHECRRHFGFDVRLLESDGLRSEYGICAPGAMVAGGDAAFDPYQFTQSLVRAGVGQGLRIFRRTAVTRIEERPSKVHLQAENAEISARAAILCTGYAVSEFLGMTPGRLNTTYAVASEPSESFDGWPAGHLLWETARPYFYARSTLDNRLIIGGEDTPGTFDHHDEALVAEKTDALVSRLGQLFPRMQFTPEYAWAGTFAESSDGLPLIGKLPGRESLYAALAYGGNGITFGMIAARLLVDLVVGRPNEDAEVFSFKR